MHREKHRTSFTDLGKHLHHLREPRQIGEEAVRDGLNLLPPKYASPKDTPLRHKVIPGKNEVPEIKVE